MAAEILAPRVRLAHNRSGANLVSGVASTLLAARRTPSSACSRSTRRRCPRWRGACGRARSASATSSATSSTATASSSSSPSAGATAVAALPADATLVVNGDDPQVGDSRAARAARVDVRRSTTRARARPALQHAADSKYCVRCGTPYDYAAAYVGHLGDYRCPACGHARPPLDVAARAIELRRARAARRSTSSRPRATRRVELALPGPLQRLQRARRRVARARARRVARRDRGGLGALRRRVRPLRADPGRRPQRLLMLLIKNPAGANEAVRTLVDGGAPRRRRDRAERRDRRRPRRLVDLGRRLRAARSTGSSTLVATGERAAELALRFKYGGLDAARDRGRARPRARRSTAGSS